MILLKKNKVLENKLLINILNLKKFKIFIIKRKLSNINQPNQNLKCVLNRLYRISQNYY